VRVESYECDQCGKTIEDPVAFVESSELTFQAANDGRSTTIDTRIDCCSRECAGNFWFPPGKGVHLTCTCGSGWADPDCKIHGSPAAPEGGAR